MDAMSESITDWPAAVRTERQRCAEAGGGKRVDVFWVDDPLTGTRLHVSAAALTWGVQPEALCGVRERWLAHVHPEDHNALRAAWDGLAHGQDFVLEYRWVCDGQAERRVRERGFMMPSAVGTSAHAVGMVEDVTQPRQTLAALAESEFQLQWLIDSVPFPLVQLDPDRRVRFANRAFAQRFGLPHEDVHGRLVRDVMGEEAYACILSHLEEGFAGRRVNFEMELPYPNGLGRRFVHGAYSPQRGADGSVQALVCVIEDITESKEAERERFRHQREFVTLVENAPDVIARLDRELRCVYVNRAVNDAFDVAPAALTGRTLTASPLSAEVAQALEGAAQRAFDTRAEQTLTLHLEDGHALPRIAHYNARVIPEADRHGVMESALLIVYDVTERTELSASAMRCCCANRPRVHRPRPPRWRAISFWPWCPMNCARRSTASRTGRTCWRASLPTAPRWCSARWPASRRAWSSRCG